MSKIELTFIERLAKIQQELVAPKTRFNKSYGGFKYRNQDDILEAVKPLLAKYELSLKLSDEFMQIGDVIFCKSTAKIFDFENSSAEAYGWSGYSQNPSQVEQNAGKSSTYARKYALNGLFLIDDSADPDMEEKEPNVSVKEKPSKPVLKEGTTEWDKVVIAIEQGRATVSQVKKHYTVSQVLLDKLK